MCRVLNISGFQNIPGFQYARVLNFQGYTGYSSFHKYGRVSEYALGWN